MNDCIWNSIDNEVSNQGIAILTELGSLANALIKLWV